MDEITIGPFTDEERAVIAEMLRRSRSGSVTFGPFTGDTPYVLFGAERFARDADPPAAFVEPVEVGPPE